MISVDALSQSIDDRPIRGKKLRDTIIVVECGGRWDGLKAIPLLSN
jgi:hypothetical protein